MQRIRKAKALLRWLRYFPEGSLDFTYDVRLRNRRWHLMNLWIRVPSSRDLFRDCPPLAFMLASCWVFRGKQDKNQFRAIRTLMKRKRTDILRWLYFPTNGNMMAVLCKLNHECISCRELMALRRLAEKKPAATMWLKEIRGRIQSRALLFLRAFSTHRVNEAADAYLTPTLQLFRAFTSDTLKKNANDGSEPIIDRLFNSSLKMIGQLTPLHRFCATQRLAGIRSRRKLLEFHDKLTRSPAFVEDRARHLVSQADDDMKQAFPVAMPFENPHDNWKPLVTLMDIARESMQMNHCLYESYHRKIADGRYFAYAVETNSGFRATLGLKKENDEHWCIDQLQDSSNQPAPDLVRQEAESQFTMLVDASRQSCVQNPKNGEDVLPSTNKEHCRETPPANEDAPPRFYQDSQINEALQHFAATL